MKTRVCAAAILCSLALLTPAGRADSVDPGEDFLARYAATDRFRSGTPRAIRPTPAGDAVLFLRAAGPRDRRQDLWTFDPRTGAERVLVTASGLLAGGEEQLTPEELARRERLRQTARGIVSFELSKDGRTLLVPLSGRLFVVDRASGTSRELQSRGGPAQDAHFSPDGMHVACVRGADVWVTEVATGRETKLTTHEGDDVSWGSPEFVAQEEMDRFEGWWWSPDSKTLIVQRTDTKGVERMRISDPANPGAEPQEWPYPRPGQANADVRLFLVPVSGAASREIAWDRAAWPYVCTVKWSAEGPPTVLLMDRAQQNARLVAIDPATGSLRELLAERDAAWINLDQSAPRWLAGGRGFLWIAERDDTGPALEWRTPGGALHARLSPPGVRVRRIVHVSPDGRAVVVEATGREPMETRLHRIDVAERGRSIPLENAPGLHAAVFSEDGTLRVRTLQPREGATRWTVEDDRGRKLGELASRAEEPGFEPNVAFECVGVDSLRAAVVLPRTFDPQLRYPVIDFVYGGPHSQEVVLRARRYLLEQWVADQGFIVVSVDGCGTPGRGRAWERAIRGDLIGPALEDQCRGVRELCARHPEMDAARIGMFGWSFGGYFTAHAMMRKPDLFRAGVAGAPVVDWRDYDTFYTERYLGLPLSDSLAYARSSVLTYANALERPLLLIHGTADDNVYFFNSLKLTDALNRAGRGYEFLPLPGQTHVVTDPAYVRQVHGRLVDFFRRELGAPGDAAPPRP